jgi:hypothetical protein
LNKNLVSKVLDSPSCSKLTLTLSPGRSSKDLSETLVIKILNKPCPPDKLKATIQAALSFKGGEQEEEKAPDFVL